MVIDQEILETEPIPYTSRQYITEILFTPETTRDFVHRPADGTLDGTSVDGTPGVWVLMGRPHGNGLVRS